MILNYQKVDKRKEMETDDCLCNLDQNSKLLGLNLYYQHYLVLLPKIL